ncbi:M23 family metallopeptidase [Streptomyces sodiiphilus]|uniref:M23 family metallopeptidase n=2 Tax=Streptomyces sodiiphilus TaxID=226217 RepID=A0ABN2PFZ8_9ACTN
MHAPYGTATAPERSDYGSYAAYGGHESYGHDPYGLATAYDNGQYAAQTWDGTPAHGVPAHGDTETGGYGGDGNGQQYGDWSTGYTANGQAGSWETGGYGAAGTIPHQSGADGWETPGDTSWQSGGHDTAEAYPAGTYGAAGTGSHGETAYGEGAWDTGSYTTGITGPEAYDAPAGHEAAEHDRAAQDTAAQDTAEHDTTGWNLAGAHDQDGPAPDHDADTGPQPVAVAADQDGGPRHPAPFQPQGSRGGGGRRRCAKPRRSALMTVAAPSIAVLGITGIAAAATVQSTDSVEDEPPVAAPDPADVQPVAANKQFDTQLESLTAAADDYAERASRTQGRLDLEAKKAAEKKAAEEAKKAAEAEAARLEALRPKFALPVERRGLSAGYGQSGINWMSVHTGIDFPVSYGTPVRAATDGTVRTQWHVSYGNMAIVTAPDGTETWYAHLSSNVYHSGYVQAGTVIAYSGNSGKSTGPHLHFEVRPGGGSPTDPAAWLRSKGLEPS